MADKEESDVSKKTNDTREGDDDEAMKKCLEKHKGDSTKCKSKVQAFNSSPSKKKFPPLKLPRGSLTDV
ncbi:hypothetical protein RJ641_016024 [Dillenia turbinata]|uniref:Uncharacterized protein n=1 Tax=Dillenia turbinata TaxID=194707 RepID=A0AAN8UR09_9MAGN